VEVVSRSRYTALALQGAKCAEAVRSACCAGLDAVLPTCLAAAGVAGLCLWAYAGWWLVLAVSSVGQTLRQGIPFTLGGCCTQLRITARLQILRMAPTKQGGAAQCCVLAAAVT
jgi:hypothetical protein